MVTFPIYVLGDATSFYSVINSVAMVFSSKGFILSTQLAAGLIALVACVAGLLGKMAGDNKLGQHPITTPLMFGAMVAFMSIPSSVTVQDIYTGSTVKVDNVPVLISAPASLFTTGAYKLFDTANTSFQSVNGSYMGVSTSGFVMPLKLLLSLRSGIDKADPYLAASVSQFIIDCIPGSTTFNWTNTAGGFGRSEDAIKYIVDNARPSGLTTYYTAAATAGAAMACQNAGQLLLTDSTKFYNSPQFVDMLNSGLKEKNPNDPKGLYKLSDLESAITNVGQVGGMVAGSAQDTRAYALNAMFYHRMNDTFRCLDSVGSQKDFNTCTMALNQSFEKWKAEAISNGTFFAKMMTPAIVFLQLMFFGFAPIVILYSLFKGAGSLGLYIKYLGFGVWTSSWLPFSAIIQMYIQNNVADKLTSIQAKHPGVLTPATFDATFNDIIGTRLALASDLLAATPMLSLALLSGSIYSLSSLANKWNGQGHTDPNLVTPPVQAAAPIFASGSSNVNRHAGSVTKEGGELNTMNFQISNNSTEASSISKREGETNTALQQLSTVNSKIDSQEFKKMWAHASQTMNASTQGTQINEGSVTFGRSGETAVTMNSEKAKAVAETTQSTLALSAGVTGAFVGGLTKAFGGKLSQPQAQQATQKAVAEISKQDAGFASRLFSNDEGVRTAAWEKLTDAAITTGTAIAVGAEVVSGVGAPAAPATAVMGMAARTAAKGAIASGVSKAIGASRNVADKLKGASPEQLANLVGNPQATSGGATAAAQLALKEDESFKNASSQQQKDAVSLMANWGYSAFRGSSTTNSDTSTVTNTEGKGTVNSTAKSNTYQEAASKMIAAEMAYMQTTTAGQGEAVSVNMNPVQMKQRFDSNPEMVKKIERDADEAARRNPEAWHAAQSKADEIGWRSGTTFDPKTEQTMDNLMALRVLDKNYRLLGSQGESSGANAGIKQAQGPNQQIVHDKVANNEKVTSKPIDVSEATPVKGTLIIGGVKKEDPSVPQILNEAYSPRSKAAAAFTGAHSPSSPYNFHTLELDAQHRNTTVAAPTGEKADDIRETKREVAVGVGLGIGANILGHKYKTDLPTKSDDKKGPSTQTPSPNGNGPQPGQPPVQPQPSGSAQPRQSPPSRPSRPARVGKSR